MGWSTSLNPDPPTITYSFITYIPFISIVYICVHDSHKYSYKLPLLNYYYLYLTSIIYIYIYILLYIYTIYLWWFQLLSHQAISAASLGAGSVGTGSAGGAESASPETSPGKAKETRTGSCWGDGKNGRWTGYEWWIWLYLYIYMTGNVEISHFHRYFCGIWEYENGGFSSIQPTTIGIEWDINRLCLGWTEKLRNTTKWRFPKWGYTQIIEN